MKIFALTLTSQSATLGGSDQEMVLKYRTEAFETKVALAINKSKLRRHRVY